MADEETTTTVDNVDEVTTVTTPEAVEETETTSTEDVEAEATEEPEAEPETEKPKADLKQRKIAKQARELREMRRQNANLARAVEEQSKAVVSSQKESKAPKIEDFEDMDTYLNARDDFRDSKREAKAEPKQEYDSSPKDDLSDIGMDKYEDFDDVVFSQDVKISQEMASAIFEIEDDGLRADVAYYLGNNPKEASKIANLSERRQVAEVAKIEMKISTKPTAKKQASNAPKPIKPIGGTKTTNNNEIKDTMSPADFERVRNKQLGRT